MNPPARQRARYALYELHRSWPVLVVALAMVLAASYFVGSTGHWVAWVTMLAPLAVVAYAAAWWAGSDGAAYDVDELLVLCRPDAYVPPGEMRPFIDRWAARWTERGYDPSEHLDGATLEIRPSPPTIPGARFWRSVTEHPDSTGLPDVDPEMPGSQAWGLTYPEAQSSVVAHEKATHMGTAGWELDLQMAHQIRGPASEGSDKTWLEAERLR